MNYVLENKHYKTLNILTFGHQKCESLHSYSYALPNFYLIHYVISGCGTFIKNKQERKVSEGELFIIKPDNVYEYTADNENPWEYMWFSFDGELSSIFEKLDDVVKIQSNIFSEMLEAKELKNTKHEYLLSKLYELISLLFEDEPSKNNYVKTVADYIKSNYAHRLSVADIANAMNLNSRYLSRIFKQEKSVTIQEYIINYKIKKAQTLLSKGFNVSEAAKAVGYDDVFTFSKIFRKHAGISPAKYKINTSNTLDFF